eukprot:gene8333-10237_t
MIFATHSDLVMDNNLIYSLDDDDEDEIQQPLQQQQEQINLEEEDEESLTQPFDHSTVKLDYGTKSLNSIFKDSNNNINIGEQKVEIQPPTTTTTENTTTTTSNKFNNVNNNRNLKPINKTSWIGPVLYTHDKDVYLEFYNGLKYNAIDYYTDSTVIITLNDTTTSSSVVTSKSFKNDNQTSSSLTSKNIGKIYKISSFWENRDTATSFVELIEIHRPEEIEGGKKPFHGSKQLFPSKQVVIKKLNQIKTMVLCTVEPLNTYQHRHAFPINAYYCLDEMYSRLTNFKGPKRLIYDEFVTPSSQSSQQPLPMPLKNSNNLNQNNDDQIIELDDDNGDNNNKKKRKSEAELNDSSRKRVTTTDLNYDSDGIIGKRTTPKKVNNNLYVNNDDDHDQDMTINNNIVNDEKETPKKRSRLRRLSDKYDFKENNGTTTSLDLSDNQNDVVDNLKTQPIADITVLENETSQQSQQDQFNEMMNYEQDDGWGDTDDNGAIIRTSGVSSSYKNNNNNNHIDSNNIDHNQYEDTNNKNKQVFNLESDDEEQSKKMVSKIKTGEDYGYKNTTQIKNTQMAKERDNSITSYIEKSPELEKTMKENKAWFQKKTPVPRKGLDFISTQSPTKSQQTQITNFFPTIAPSSTTITPKSPNKALLSPSQAYEVNKLEEKMKKNQKITSYVERSEKLISSNIDEEGIFQNQSDNNNSIDLDKEEDSRGGGKSMELDFVGIQNAYKKQQSSTPPKKKKKSTTPVVKQISTKNSYFIDDVKSDDDDNGYELDGFVVNDDESDQDRPSDEEDPVFRKYEKQSKKSKNSKKTKSSKKKIDETVELTDEQLEDDILNTNIRPTKPIPPNKRKTQKEDEDLDYKKEDSDKEEQENEDLEPQITSIVDDDEDHEVINYNQFNLDINTPNTIKKQVEKEFSKKFSIVESFNIFIQYIISCVLDKEFANSVLNDENDDGYFTESLKKIRDLVVTKKEILVRSSSWHSQYLEDLSYRPQMREQEVENLPGKCQSCQRTKHNATFIVFFSGKPYSVEDFWEGYFQKPSPIEELKNVPKEVQYELGSHCYKRSNLFHQLHHYPYNLYENVKKSVKKHQKDNPDESPEKVIESMLSNTITMEYDHYIYVQVKNTNQDQLKKKKIKDIECYVDPILEAIKHGNLQKLFEDNGEYGIKVSL